MIKIRPSFRRILEYPDILRHLENRLRQTGCFGVRGMIKSDFTEKYKNDKNGNPILISTFLYELDKAGESCSSKGK